MSLLTDAAVVYLFKEPVFAHHFQCLPAAKTIIHAQTSTTKKLFRRGPPHLMSL